MLRSYGPEKPSEKSLELAEKITALVVSSAVTYQEAEDALEAAQLNLRNTAILTKRQILP